MITENKADSGAEGVMLRSQNGSSDGGVSTPRPAINANKIVFRCSELGKILTNGVDKKTMGDTAKGYLVSVYVREKYGRFKEVTSKFMEKGNLREQDALTLLSRVTKVFHKKNELRLTNEFITGEPDAFIGESIDKAEETFDTKCSWSANTFFDAQRGKIDPDYKAQGHGYMALTGAKKHTISYCLVNSTIDAILDEKRKLQYLLNVIDPEQDKAYMEKCKQVEINHIFDLQEFIKEYPHFDFHNDVSKWTYDIPKEDRLYCITIERDEAEIIKIYDRVREARGWMDTELFKMQL